MKRYFEIIGQQTVMLLDLKPPVSKKSVEELSEQLKMELRELDRSEYGKPAKEYTR